MIEENSNIQTPLYSEQSVLDSSVQLNRKKNIVLIVSALLVLILGFGISSLFLKDSESATTRIAQNTTETQSTPQLAQDASIDTISDGFIYKKTLSNESFGPGQTIYSSVDGVVKKDLGKLTNFNGYFSQYDFIPSLKRNIYLEKLPTGGQTFMLLDEGEELVSGPKIDLPTDSFIESPKLTLDGQKVAFTASRYIQIPDQQYSRLETDLWVYDIQTGLSEIVGSEIHNSFPLVAPFRYVPIGWSKDNSKIYMSTTSDSEATPEGMYVFDLATKKIAKALAPNKNLSDSAFSADNSKLIYSSFEWEDIPDGRPIPSAPYTLNSLDMTTGQSTVILSNDSNRLSNPIPSPDGTKILYKVSAKDYFDGDTGIYVLDLKTKKSQQIAENARGSTLQPERWMDDKTIIYTEQSYSSGEVRDRVNAYLYSINADGTEKKLIDSAPRIVVFTQRLWR